MVPPPPSPKVLRDVFAALKSAVDAQLLLLADQLPSLGGGEGRATAEAALDEWRLLLGRLQRWLLPDLFRLLLQRLWLEQLDTLAETAPPPREANPSLQSGAEQTRCAAACALLGALQELLYCGGQGPSWEWLLRKAAPMRDAYALAGIRVDAGRRRVSFAGSPYR